MCFLRQRRRQHEWMDDPAVDSALLDRSLRFIRHVNRWLGYTRATVGHLDRLTRSWPPDRTIRLLDVATGSADVPRAILRWATRRGLDVRIIGLDRHPQTARLASAFDPPDARIGIVRGDALRLPFSDGAFDYALTSMFLHHLDDDDAAGALAEMNRVARRGIIASDLIRGCRAYAWITLFTAFANPIVRHDARASVAQAFRRREVLELRSRAGIGYALYHRHFGHRFALSGNKPFDGRQDVPGPAKLR